jgi:hypothetical protein
VAGEVKKILIYICVLEKINPNGIFVNIGGSGRVGLVNIRTRPAPGIGAKF